MKKKNLVLVILGMMVVMGGLNLLNARSIRNYSREIIMEMPKSDLSKLEIKNLVLMREEEKLARDVYITLGKMWSLPVFKNISKSEEVHMNAIKVLLDKYNLNDPVKSNRIGKFTSKKLKKLYDELVAKGSKSLLDALIVGAMIEDLDISDLNKAIANTDNQDIEFVYKNLRRGSYNHLRAFTRQIKFRNGNYKSKFLD